MPVGIAFFDTFLANLQEWVDDLDLTPEMLISWIAMAEERFNNELRCNEMVVTRRIFLADQCIPFPPDFLRMISIRYVTDGLPLRYVSSDEYWRVRSASQFYLSGPQTTAITYLDPATGQPVGPLPRQPAFVDYPGRSGPKLPLAHNIYTFIGNVIYVHPTVVDIDPGDTDTMPTEIELAYYAKVLPLATAIAPTPLFVRSPKLYTYGALAHSAPFLVEDQRATIWDSNVTALIKGMNDAAMIENIVSSPITMQVRSFG